MNTRSMIVITSLLAALFAAPAFAQTTPTPAAPAPGGVPTAKVRDCSQAPNPAACQERREARAKLMEACRDKAGAERRQCMHEQRMAATDCAKTGDPQRCEARKQAYEGCKGQDRAGMRQCMEQKMPPVDCSKAGNPQRCEQHQKAREVCKDKAGPEQRACLRQQLQAK